MNVILNLSNNILTETQYNQGFYDVDDSNKELLTELLTFQLGILTPQYLQDKAKKLAELALKSNANPMVPLNKRSVYIDPPVYFSKYLENALLTLNLKPLYIINDSYVVVTEKEEIPNVDIDLSTPMTFEELQQLKKEEIAQKRWEEEIAPYYYEPKNARFDTSVASQIKYTMAINDLNEIEWKTYDGWVTMQPLDFGGLITAYTAYVKQLFHKESLLSKQIDEALKVDDLNLINW